MNDKSELTDRLIASRDSRQAYIKGKLNVLIPAQLRALRLRRNMLRQKDLAKAAGMHQSQISNFETPGTNLTIDTLARLAATLEVALEVKFVPFSEMLRWDNEFSQDTFDAIPISKDREFLNPSAIADCYTSAVWMLADLMNFEARLREDSSVLIEYSLAVASAKHKDESQRFARLYVRAAKRGRRKDFSNLAVKKTEYPQPTIIPFVSMGGLDAETTSKS